MGLGQKSIKINGADCGVEALILGWVTAMGGFLFGYDTGQISGMLIFNDFRRRFATGELDDEGIPEWVSITQSLMVSLMSLGTLIGALSGAYTADAWGRRRSLSFGVAIFIIGNIIQITAMNSWIHMMMGRFVAGLGIGNLSVGVPMFQSECSPREIRGAVVASYQLLITFGILISNILNYGVRTIQDDDASWRIVIGLGIFFSLPLGIGILFVPESPRWLGARGDWDGARMSLARLRGLKHDPSNRLIERDFVEMRDVIETEHSVGTGTWAECFTGGGGSKGIPKIVYRTFLGIALHFAQQWTGVNYFFYYGATVFKSAGIEDPIQTQLILGAVNVLCTFWGLYVVEKFGRRLPLIVGAFWQAAWLAVFASVGTALPPETNSTTGIVMIVSACMFIASFASTWGPIAWVVIGETFTLRTRAKQASLATAGNWLGNFLLSLLTPPATAGISFKFGYVFTACNVAGGLLVYFFLYESRMLSLENVDRMYGEPNVKPWNSKKWTPPGYLTRKQRDDSSTGVGTDDEAVAHTREKTGTPDVPSEQRHEQAGDNTTRV
ncbi:high-affinity glucose transporter ght2 [Gaeumannomyces tritici R3-111a-1]|uniref:High-affinity glucose transporter ght2 n=1 Tax=Gaeumannomyces tritici (strain R3-111a-1) TaxID=644352 RepID=J3P6Z0_GAET3|nr:high-affinity glucose transporter ght2 [Gaeumannomyces tritici R3-111a-1]EJT72421.1 high-affinity glucose transporter ght2 [Gaeumannomyces tritici R3-111a-1]